MTINLIYIGEDFYDVTSTMMSSLYHEDGHRSHWGKVSAALRNGDEVHIRPANDAEMVWAYKMRDEVVADLKARGWEYGKPQRVVSDDEHLARFRAEVAP